MLQAATSTSIIQLHISENLTQPMQWICCAKSARLGLSDSKVVSLVFRLLSCALMRGIASMILNQDLY